MRRGRVTIVLLVAGWLGSGAACSRSNDAVASGATRAPVRRAGAPDRDAADGGRSVVRVGNQVGGVDDQPDYDAEAETVRRDVQGRLPSPLPPVARACARMLDAVSAYYVGAEGKDSTAVRNLAATREQDLAACKAHTSAAAASCVAVLMADQAAEYPRALDQCNRAFAK